MSTSDHLLLILHIGFAIFTLGPLTAATMSTPRYIRKGNTSVVRYLNRTTQIYGVACLGIFLFGMLLGSGQFDQMWLSASMTLFIVALVLLLIVDRDQRRAVHLLETAGAAAVPAGPSAPAAGETADGEERPEDAKADDAKAADAKAATASGADVAQVERGRIAALSGVIALIWLVILVLMVWNG
ncbi:hypothetical protein [Actinomadura sp. WAC 06369]|uniref:hypothetical protein n=1 Tax=Actinomadura sp. WAC 06369 TaxID=2203193 RepID=UPI000F7B1A77|nr:hypothetical protein [Actinomadura sp. WAC 06369]RSN70689.1 hypothetical protein DMH08_05095 [Actinomadura sp. WAC 06369]